MGEKGTTLIEMMVAAIVVVVIAAAGYTFSINTSTFQTRHERIKDMHIRLQSAMGALVYKVRQVHYGTMNPLSTSGEVFQAAQDKAFINPIVATNSTTTSDALAILRMGQPPIGVLSETALSGTAVIQVLARDDFAEGYGTSADRILRDIPLLTLGGLFTQSINAVAMNGRMFTFTLNGTLGKRETYPAGFPVDGFTGVTTYTIGVPSNREAILIGAGKSTTTASLIDKSLLENGALFAHGIEDLQVAYLLEAPDANGNWVVHNPQGASFRALRLSLTAIAEDPTPHWKGKPVALEDHQVGTSTDAFHRATLTRVVELRNM